MKTCSLWEYDISIDSFESVVAWCLQPSTKLRRVVTLNPQMVMQAEALGIVDWLRSADLVVPDGQGIVWGMKRLCRVQVEPVAGSDLVDCLIGCGLSVYLVGAAPDVVAKAADNVAKQTDLKGFCDGYSGRESWVDIARDIEQKKPDLILVGMGYPLQEAFIEVCAQQVTSGIIMGVGGVIDVLSGTVARAPQWVRALKLEWLYRGLGQPTRMKKWHFLAGFVVKILNARSKS